MADAKLRAGGPRPRSQGLWYSAGVTARRAPHERFACDLDVELETDRGRVVGRGRDMNDSAVCLTADAPVEPGTQVQVHLRLVLEWGASEALVVPGQVAWLTDTEGAQQIGVVFSVLAPELRQRLTVLSRVLNGQISLPAPSH